MQPDEKLLCSPEEKVHLEISNQADVIDFLADFVAKGRTRITESDVLAIHDLTIKGYIRVRETFAPLQLIFKL
jgi:hypothetical protein